MNTSKPDTRERIGWPDTANDRFKRSFGSRLSGSLILATGLHFGLFAFTPSMTAEDVSFTAEDLEAVFMEEIALPAAPEPLPRPAAPVPVPGDVPLDVVWKPTPFDGPPDALPPPPAENQAERDVPAGPVLTPMTVRPAILNEAEVARALERAYPPLLRNAGIGGTVGVWFLIDEEGRVRDTRIDQSSGHPQLDEAALEVADLVRFSPALNLDRRVSVWISMPITFRVR